MKVTIKATNLELTTEIKEAIEEKIGTLDRFIPNINMPLEAVVEVGRETRHHKKGKIYYAEVNIRMPGKVLRSEAKEENIFKAINTVKDELQLLLKKYKKRQIGRKKHENFFYKDT